MVANLSVISLCLAALGADALLATPGRSPRARRQGTTRRAATKQPTNAEWLEACETSGVVSYTDFGISLAPRDGDDGAVAVAARDVGVGTPLFGKKAPAAAPEPAAPRVANAAKDYEDFNPDQPDIIQKFVKSRDDWWSSESPFPGAPVAKGSGDSPVDALVQLPLPAYFWLLSATVGSIAFVGCIFQLFYNVPRAPVLGVPLTSVILVASGPAFVFFFLVAIARGQKEADDDDAKYNM